LLGCPPTVKIKITEPKVGLPTQINTDKEEFRRTVFSIQFSGLPDRLLVSEC